jgi:hypothetical protein
MGAKPARAFRPSIPMSRPAGVLSSVVAPRRASRSVLLALTLAAAIAGEAATTPPPPPVGAWATYRWTSSVTQPVPVLVQQPGPGGRVSWSVVQESASPPPLFVTYGIVRADRRTFTLQIVTHERQDGPPLSVTQITVNTSTGKASRSVTQRPKGVIDTPESGLRPLRETDVPQGKREDVTVPAGRFSAIHGTVRGAEVWVSDQVPPMGLVKATWPSGTLELVRSETRGAPDLLKAAAR